MKPCIEIKGRPIGPGQPVYIIAEMSANHGQDFDQAVRIIHAAKAAGADAVKVQTYTADTLTLNCRNPYFQITDTIWKGRTLYELYAEAYMPWEWQAELKKIAEGIGLDFFSTPFDDTAVDFLSALDVPAFKVASFEIVDLPLLQKIARTGKPVILSTGMATEADIHEALTTISQHGGNATALLKCTSAYPAPFEEMHLRTIPHMAETFAVPVGLSDHSMGWTVAVAAVVLGACLIEKHFTLFRSDPGPDSSFSMEPEEFAQMVKAIRIAEKALGTIEYQPSGKQKQSLKFRRSLFVAEDIRQGETFSNKNVRSIRPADGLHPRHFQAVLGKKARQDIQKGTPLSWEHVAHE